MSLPQFSQYNQDKNEPLRKYVAKCSKENVKPKFALPESERIYYKDFHFLDEPLVDKKRPEESEPKPTKEAAPETPEESKQPASASSNLVFSNQKDE